MSDYAADVRERELLVASAVLVLAGVVASFARGGDDHVGPPACARRVAHALHFETLTDPSVSDDRDTWVATMPTARLVVRVTGIGHDVTDVQALAGPGADVLNRSQRLVGLAVQC
jgi:hypothetical protein